MTQDPARGGPHGGGPSGHAIQTRLWSSGPAIDLSQGASIFLQVDMRVGEAGKDGSSVKVNDVGFWSCQGEDRRVGADSEEPLSLDRQR